MVKDLGPQVSWRTVFVTEYVRFFFFSSLVCRLTSLYIYIYIRLVHSSFTQFCIIYPKYSIVALCNTANCKSACIISLVRRMGIDCKLDTCTQWSSYTLPNGSSSPYCTRLSGCFVRLIRHEPPSHIAFIDFRTRQCL